MTTATLTDRYVDAAMRTVPEQQRADLAAELRGAIADQIEARVSAGDTAEAAERTVLTDFGDPEKLAAGYTDRPLQLIGPRYYLAWWRLLKTLLWIVPACAAFGVGLGQVLSGASFGELLGNVASVTISVIVNVAFWTTLVFAVVERTAGRAAAGGLAAWSPDQLPEPRRRGVGWGEIVWSLAGLAILAGVILWDVLIGFVPTEPGLSFLNPDLWPWWIATLLVLLVLEVLLAITVYARGHWEYGTAAVNLALNLVIAGGALWLLIEGELINPAYFPTVMGDAAAEVGPIVATIAGFAIAVGAVWDGIDGFRKVRRD